MGKKCFLWVVVALLVAVGADLLCTQYHLEDPVPVMVGELIMLFVITRLIFDFEYSQASWNQTFFLYAVNAVVCLTFLFSAYQIISSIRPTIPDPNTKLDDTQQILKNYERRLSDARNLNVSLNNKLTELDGNSSDDSIIMVGPTDFLVISERDKKLREELAVRNLETIAATAISIEKEDGDFVRGRVVFATEPKKNGIFFGYYSREKNVWEVFINEGNDGLRCEGYPDWDVEIPKSMFEDCESYKDKGDISVASDWKLTAGNPNQDCSSVEYSGKEEVDAWLEWRTNYVEKTWLLAIAENDRPKLLLNWPWKPYFNITDLSGELRSKLMTASEKNPVKVTVRKISHYCEGQPSLGIEE